MQVLKLSMGILKENDSINSHLKILNKACSFFWYIESFYNQKQIHQGLNYLTPNEFEVKKQIIAI